jgi:hypothetical protein
MRFIFFVVVLFTANAFSFTDTLLSKSGKYTITWGFDDANGNTLSLFQVIFIKDTMAPVPQKNPLDTVKGQCFAFVTDTPTAYDHFSKTIIKGKTASPLNYTRQGTYTVSWLYDNGRKTTTQNQIVRIKDTIPPVLIGPGSLPTITVDSAFILKSPKARDNCGTDTITGRVIQMILDTTAK